MITTTLYEVQVQYQLTLALAKSGCDREVVENRSQWIKLTMMMMTTIVMVMTMVTKVMVMMTIVLLIMTGQGGGPLRRQLFG